MFRQKVIQSECQCTPKALRSNSFEQLYHHDNTIASNMSRDEMRSVKYRTTDPRRPTSLECATVQVGTMVSGDVSPHGHSLGMTLLPACQRMCQVLGFLTSYIPYFNFGFLLRASWASCQWLLAAPLILAHSVRSCRLSFKILMENLLIP